MGSTVMLVLLLVSCLTPTVLSYRVHELRLVLGGKTQLVQRENFSTTAMPNDITEDVCENCVCGVSRQTRIVNGQITNNYEFPWAVAITYQGLHHCGASLITRKHILTAAHCIVGFQKKYFGVRLPNSKSKFRIRKLTTHKDYNKSTYDNDIAVVELDRPVPKDESVATVCLPNAARYDLSGETGTAIGWGRIGEGEALSDELRKVDLPIMSKEDCQKSNYATDRVTDNMFCAGYLKGVYDSCSGDSGGALHVQNLNGAMEVVGIVSFGRGCARPNFPGVYTKVSNYLDWIADRIRGSCLCPPPTRDFFKSSRP